MARFTLFLEVSMAGWDTSIFPYFIRSRMLFCLAVVFCVCFLFLLRIVQLPDSFWEETNSCFRQLRYYEGYKGLVVCTFKSGCAGNYTSSYLDLPDANLVSIDFRRNNSLYSSNNLHLFKRLGIINNLHWAEYHAVIYRLLLNPSEGVQNSVQTVLSQFPTKWFTVAAHIRCAGKIANYNEQTVMVGERQLPRIAEMIRALLKVYSGESNQTLFIATDSSYALEYLSQALYPIQVLSNNQVVRGHSTGTKQLIVHSTLTDLFLLTRSEAFIGVHKSSLSRVTAALSCPKRVKWFDYQYKSRNKLKKVNTTKLVKLILCCYEQSGLELELGFVFG